MAQLLKERQESQGEGAEAMKAASARTEETVDATAAEEGRAQASGGGEGPTAEGWVESRT